MADTSNPWGAGGDAGQATGGADWLAGSGADQAAPAFDILHPFDQTLIPLDVWVEQALNWLVSNFRPVFQAVRWPIDTVLTGIEHSLMVTPALLMIVIIGLLAWQAAGRRIAISAMISMAVIGMIGAWDEAMVTLALVLTSVFFCIVIGLPTGIWLARSERATSFVRPILDAMQTTPAFVYLVPIVMLVRHRQRAGRGGDHHLRPAAVDPPDQPGYPAGSGRSGRGGALVRRLAAAVAVQGPASAGDADHHGRRQSDPDAGAFHGRHRVDDRRRRTRPDGAARHRPSRHGAGGGWWARYRSCWRSCSTGVTQAMGRSGREKGNVKWYQTGPIAFVRGVLGRRDAASSDAAPAGEVSTQRDA